MLRFNGICLATKDIMRLKNFYQDIFQVEIEEEGDNFARLVMNGAELSFFTNEGMEKMAPGSMEDAGFGSYTIEIEVDNVDEEFERLKQKQVVIVKPPTTQTWGRRSVWFKDPDGNIINFYARVK